MKKALHILLIEDSEADALLILLDLRKGPFEITSRRVDSEKGLREALEDESLELILCDYSMPGFSGIQALEIFLRKGLDIPFIFVSGSIGEDVAIDAMHRGAHDYVMKGNLARLMPAIERELREAETRREKKKAQGELVMYRDHLEDLVKERTEELIKSQEKLKLATMAAESANLAKSEFLANMSHEIRTPMNAIIGFSDLLFSSVKDEKQLSQIGSIRRSARSLLEIINDILDLSKIEAGKFNIQYTPVNIYQLCKDIEVIFSQKIEEKGIALMLELSPDIPQSLLLDETRIRQILFNLVGNAAKFTEKGYVKLRLDQNKNSVLKGRINLTFSVEDTGIGIRADQQLLILKPFYQQEGQSTKKYGGTGLGLAITSRLVEMMGGKITIKSEPGKGSIFKVSLVNVEISEEEVILKEELNFNPKSVFFKEGTVLIVDDNSENRNLIMDLLGYSSLTLIEATNGKEAIDMAKKYRPDLILMDLVMPEMNGLEAIKALKRYKDTESIPVIAISASLKSLIVDSEQRKFFVDILLKPIRLSELVDKMKKYLKYEIVDRVEEVIETIQQAAEYTAEQIARFPEIIHILETEYLTEFKKVKQNQLINEMENFGKNILTMGEKYSLKILIQFGKEVCLYADNFDIVKLPGTLDKFPLIIESLKAIQHSHL